MASTLAELRSQLLEELKIDPNSRINSTALLNRNINRALRRIEQDANYSLPENVVVGTITASSQEENLPSAFKRIANPHGVKLGDSTPLYPVDYVALVGSYDLTENTGQPFQYYIRKTSSSQYVIGFYPSPTTSYTITVPYYKSLTEMTDDTDESPLNEDYDEAIVTYAVYLTMRRIKGFEEMAASYRLIYRDIMGVILSTDQVPNQYELRVGYERRPSSGTEYISPRAIGDNYSY